MMLRLLETKAHFGIKSEFTNGIGPTARGYLLPLARVDVTERLLRVGSVLAISNSDIQTTLPITWTISSPFLTCLLRRTAPGAPGRWELLLILNGGELDAEN
jgi:hypothetical protein